MRYLFYPMVWSLFHQFRFFIKAQTLNNFEWYSQLNLENSRLNATKPQLIFSLQYHSIPSMMNADFYTFNPPLEFLNSSFLSFTRNFSILCQHCWDSALNTAKYPMANSIVLWSNHRINAYILRQYRKTSTREELDFMAVTCLFFAIFQILG